MSRRSRTPMVLLGLLCTEPMSGYELKAAVERTVGHFWTESFGQIYPALKALEADGFIVTEEVPSGGRPRRVHSITKSGRKRLAAWLAEPPQATPTRNELLLKVFFGEFAPDGALSEHLVASLAAARLTVGTIEAISTQLQAEEESASELRFWLLTLDLGRRMAVARAEWAQHALAQLGAHRG
jgi:PadR family transcriptional regulator, regulatory protein AphA